MHDLGADIGIVWGDLSPAPRAVRCRHPNKRQKLLAERLDFLDLHRTSGHTTLNLLTEHDYVPKHSSGFNLGDSLIDTLERIAVRDKFIEFQSTVSIVLDKGGNVRA